MSKISAFFKGIAQKLSHFVQSLNKKQKIMACCLSACVILAVTGVIIFAVTAANPNQDANPTDSITTNQKPSESDSTGNTDDTEKPTGSTENTENTDGTDPTEPDTGDDIKLDIDIDEAEKDVVKVEKPPEQITGPTDGSNPTDGNDISYGLFLSENSLSLKKGQQAKLTLYAYLPQDSVTVYWASSDDKIATVDKNGNVKGVSAGRAKIGVTTADKKYTASCLVVVTDPDSPKPTDPTEKPTEKPTEEPTERPTEAPTEKPTEKPTEPPQNLSAQPNVTICTQVATGIYIVGGTCSTDTEYIQVSGNNATTTYLYPDYGTSSAYFIGQVKISGTTSLAIQGKQPGKELSGAVTKPATNKTMSNLMTRDEYMPVFGKNSRMHFYSAILSYSLSDVVNSSLQNRAKENITRNVQTVKSANPNAELIYLVVPSSAAVYPETIPDGYSKATGKTVYDTFSDIAKSAGATVIYPLSTFTAHKNDGLGYKIYNNTDSHWSTYGAYWGVAELMNHISGKFPAAAPRTVGEMGFYTKELWGGDSLFSFGDHGGFENISTTGGTGLTAVTKISELTTLYSRQMPTSTISSVYRGNKSVYVGGNNSGAATVRNPNGSGLPSALILRDSFACTAYDMVNDRFSTVYWQNSHTYNFPADAVQSAKPDYVIYLISERNLLKVMLENPNVSIVQYAR